LLTKTLLPGGIGGDPRLVLGEPRPRHTDALLAQADDVDVLAAGLGVTKTNVTQLVGSGLPDRSIAVDVVDTGPVAVGEALSAAAGLRSVLEERVVRRVEDVAHLDDLLQRGDDLGLLGDLLEGGR
jgi:hypothetical protein